MQTDNQVGSHDRPVPGPRGLGRRITSTASAVVTLARSDGASPSRTTDPRRALIAALIPCVTFLAFAAVRIASQPRLNFDERIFLDVGRHIVDTGLPLRAYAQPGPPRLFFDHTPLYVYFVALVTALGGPTALIVRSTTLVFGLLTILLVFRIGLEVRGLGSALVGSMLVATNPFFVQFSWFVRMEVPLCFFLVLALFLMMRDRVFLGGLAIATAVMLKEIALAFWLVAVVYVLLRRGGRAAAILAFPTPLALGAWLVYANDIGHQRLLATMGRWFGSAVGVKTKDPRIHIGLRTWVNEIIRQVVGPVMIFVAGATAALLAIGRKPVPPIVLVPIVYVVVAVASSFVISLKEPRYLVAIVPMIALSIALLLDWDEVWAKMRGRDTPAEDDQAPVTAPR